ncbi:zona pellucida sperm-binding protein 3-like [Pristis pectinata]|uniref:zona pellucida sperm-binding protein 3-like n=1 Tax=Pristis pectinata TaxID=685728 RepID=UPI00223E3949|nr:zona pellucida sperm-binding protein 3-like [Pristis pectinata]
MINYQSAPRAPTINVRDKTLENECHVPYLGRHLSEKGGIVCGSDIWQQFRGQRFPWRNVKPGVESKFGSYFRKSEVQSLSPLSGVVVQCREHNLLVRVHVDLFRTKHLIKAADVTLERAGCRPTSIYTQNHTIFFDYGLYVYGSELQMVGDYLVYTTHLNHTPQAHGATIVRTNGAIVPVQCRYFRKGNVRSNPMKPTWIPFSSTRSGERRLSFSLWLMNDDWLTEHSSTTYYLGELIHIEASISMINHMPLKLYIDRCVATLSRDKYSTPRCIIDYNGFLLDSAAEDSFSAFVLAGAEREVDKLRFDLDAFRFFGDERSLFITCRLKVAAVDQIDPVNKASTFQKTQNMWAPLEETSVDICSCCRVGDCTATREGVVHSRDGGTIKLRLKDGGMNWEVDASLGPLIILEPEVTDLATQSFHETEQRGRETSPAGEFFNLLPTPLATVSFINNCLVPLDGVISEAVVLVALVVTAVFLATTTLIVIFLYRKRKQTPFN